MADNFTPFESIGLCFSGGGYRATFFSLGVISYLNRIEYKGNSLLNNVEAISTVSGGTLLGVGFAKAIQSPDFDFNIFYQVFYDIFKPNNDKLLENAIAILEDNIKWDKEFHKKRTVINAFALAYSGMDVFKGDFKMFKDLKTSKLKHVCFNATDFSFGLPFRFQNTGIFGNMPLRCKELNKIKDEIKLADIVASSSCFPLGFEPLIFPDDYFENQKNDDYKALKRLDKFINGVGVMDGGITDNQGIGSMVNISKLKSRKKPLDLIIVNDVGSYKMTPWEQNSSTSTNKKSLKNTILSFLKYFTVRWVYWVILLAGVIVLIINSLKIIKQTSWSSLYVVGGILTGIGLILTILGLIALIGKKIGISWFRAAFKKSVPEALIDDISSFQNLNIGLIKIMLTERITSAVKMVNDVFLKQIRRLNYDLLYATEDLQKRIITSTVYELNGVKSLYGDQLNKEIKPTPSKQLIVIGLTASEAPTTLWWDETDKVKNRMDTLIACGQFTTCYKLMDYILKLKKQGIATKEMELMYKLLLKDWKEFNKNPLFMV